MELLQKSQINMFFYLYQTPSQKPMIDKNELKTLNIIDKIKEGSKFLFL